MSNPDQWDNIPQELKGVAQWMVCDSDKIPRSVRTGHYADNTDASNWASFHEAYVYAFERGMNIGFCFTAGLGLTCIDIDNKADPTSELFAANQQRSIAMYKCCDSYIEQSISGKGLHIIVQGEVGRGRRRDNIEVYSQERFIVITGDVQKNMPISEGQEFLDQLIAYMGDVPKEQSVDMTEIEPAEDFNAVAERILRSKSADKFIKLSGPDWANAVNDNNGLPYGDDPSRADFAFSTLLGFFTKSNRQIWEMFKMTPLGNRLKNGSTRHANYEHFRDHTIRGAREFLAQDAAREAAVDLSGAVAAKLEEFKQAQAEQAQREQMQAQHPSPVNWSAPAPNTALQMVSKYQFDFAKPDDLLAEPPLQWAVENVFKRVSVNAIYGWSGVGKSFVALDLMLAIADGREWFGHETEKMDITYLALEGGDGMAMRLEAHRRGKKLDKLPANVDIYRGKFNLTDPEMISCFIAQRKLSGALGGVIVLDTFAKALGAADENSAKDMSPVVEVAELIKEQLQACVIIIHHSTKPNAEGVAGMMRGSGAIQAGVDGVIEVCKRAIEEGEGNQKRFVGWHRFFRMAKVKESEDGHSTQFELEQIKIGERTRKSGEIVDITSCYIDDPRQAVNSSIAPVPSAAREKPTYDYNKPQSGKQATRPRTEAPIGGGKNQRLIIDAILNDSGKVNNIHMGKHGAPPGIPCAPAESAIDEAIRLKPDGGDPTQMKRDFRKVVKQMIDAGKIGTNNEENGGKLTQWIWPIGI